MGLFDNIGSLFASDNTLGIQSWSSPELVRAMDGVPSNALLLLGITSNYLKVQQFQFMVPLDATVLGIKVTVVRWSAVNLGTQDASVRLYKGGTMVGNDKASTTSWTVSPLTMEYGGPTDLWGTTWTPQEVNHTLFGVGFAAKALIAAVASVDYINVTVYYQGSNRVPADTGMFSVQGDGVSTSGTVW